MVFFVPKRAHLFFQGPHVCVLDDHVKRISLREGVITGDNVLALERRQNLDLVERKEFLLLGQGTQVDSLDNAKEPVHYPPGFEELVRGGLDLADDLVVRQTLLARRDLVLLPLQVSVRHLGLRESSSVQPVQPKYVFEGHLKAASSLKLCFSALQRRAWPPAPADSVLRPSTSPLPCLGTLSR